MVFPMASTGGGKSPLGTAVNDAAAAHAVGSFRQAAVGSGAAQPTGDCTDMLSASPPPQLSSATSLPQQRPAATRQPSSPRILADVQAANVANGVPSFALATMAPFQEAGGGTGGGSGRT